MRGGSNMAIQQQGLSVSPVNVKPLVTPHLTHDITQVGRYSRIQNKATTPQQDPLLVISQRPHSARSIQSKPLPITQREPGPISVGNALRTLMGNPVFTLVVDPVHRLITFKLKSECSHLTGVS